MLVLSRRHGEAIRIHEHVTVTVLAIRGNRVQLGIEAPADVFVQRSELPVKRAPAVRSREPLTGSPVMQSTRAMSAGHQ